MPSDREQAEQARGDQHGARGGAAERAVEEVRRERERDEHHQRPGHGPFERGERSPAAREFGPEVGSERRVVERRGAAREREREDRLEAQVPLGRPHVHHDGQRPERAHGHARQKDVEDEGEPHRRGRSTVARRRAGAKAGDSGSGPVDQRAGAAPPGPAKVRSATSSAAARRVVVEIGAGAAAPRRRPPASARAAIASRTSASTAASAATAASRSRDALARSAKRPEPRRVVARRRGERRAVGRELEREDVRRVPAQHEEFVAGRGVVEPDRAVVAAGRDAATVGRERDARRPCRHGRVSSRASAPVRASATRAEAVVARGRDERAVGRERHAGDARAGAVEGRPDATRRRGPAPSTGRPMSPKTNRSPGPAASETTWGPRTTTPVRCSVRGSRRTTTPGSAGVTSAAPSRVNATPASTSSPSRPRRRPCGAPCRRRTPSRGAGGRPRRRCGRRARTRPPGPAPRSRAPRAAGSVATLKTRTDPSQPAVAMRRPSGENATS